MKFRDDLELSVLAEFGPELAEAAGEAYQHCFDNLLHIMGFDPQDFKDFEDQLDLSLNRPEESL